MLILIHHYLRNTSTSNAQSLSGGCWATIHTSLVGTEFTFVWAEFVVVWAELVVVWAELVVVMAVLYEFCQLQSKQSIGLNGQDACLYLND